MASGIIYTEVDARASIVLDSPANANALSPELMGEIVAALGEAEGSADVGVVVLTGAGSTFCSGLDFRGKPTAEALRAALESAAALYEAILTFPKPVVCRLGGHARGAGVGLVAVSDIVLASADATLALPEVRFGMLPAVVACTLPGRIRNRSSALDLLLTGEPVDTRRAAEIGLVDHIVAADALDDELELLTEQLLRGDSPTQRRIKSLVRRLPDSWDRGFVNTAISEAIEHLTRERT